MQRLIFEVSDQSPRLAIYDFESRELIAEIEGTARDRIFAELDLDGKARSALAPSARISGLGSSVGEMTRAPYGGAPSFVPSIGARAAPTEARPLISIPTPTPSLPAFVAATAPSGSAAKITGPSPLKTNGRRKLWDLPHKYHCPIIGTCLRVDELRRIGDRTAHRPDGPLSEFDVHVSFVAAATDRNALSLATHKMLEKKYGASVRRFAKARDSDALLKLWNDSLDSGDVPGGLWALMTHPRTDHRMMTRAYEDVHMLSHQIGAGQRADLKRLTDTRLRLDALQRDFDLLHARTRQQANERETRIRSLETALAKRDRDWTEARERERCLLARIEAMNGPGLHARIDELVAQVAEMDSELGRIRIENEDLRRARANAEEAAAVSEQARRAAEAECRATERLVQHLLADRCEGCTSDVCPRPRDLAGRLVLCVGGRKQLVEHYRALVAGCNGRFDHHDGGMEDNQRRLEAMLASADIVVCATDYVSHDAYYRTKRFCKHNEKPHVLLGNSGISSFALAIETLAA